MTIALVAFLIGTILIATVSPTQTYWGQTFFATMVISWGMVCESLLMTENELTLVTRICPSLLQLSFSPILFRETNKVLAQVWSLPLSIIPPVLDL